MANDFYVKGAQRVLQGQVNFTSANVKAALVDNTYAVNLATHEFFTDISAVVIGTPVALANKALVGKAFDADDVTFVAPAPGDTALAVVLYVDTGVAGTSPLLAYLDTVVGFPLATNGADVIARFDSGAYRILSL